MQGAGDVESTADERVRKKREAAATSRSEKRKSMGNAAYLQDKRETEQRRRERKAAGHAAAATPMAAVECDVGDACAGGYGMGSAPLPTAFAVPLPMEAAPAVDIATQLERVAALREKGLLDDDEFKAAKAQLLAK